jgi:uncharacterized peroxidase-related enzyme
VALPEYEQIARFSRLNTTSSSTNLPVVEEDGATGEVAELDQFFRDHFGRPDVPGILKCFATHPPLLRHMMTLSESLIFSDGHLTRRHKEMIATLVSTQNACPYCADSHGFFLRMHGGSAETLSAVQQSDLTSPALTGAEQVLLAFVEKVNENSHAIEATDVKALNDIGWSDEQIAEAVHVTALFSTFNRVANTFGLKPQGLLALYKGQLSMGKVTSATGKTE